VTERLRGREESLGTHRSRCRRETAAAHTRAQRGWQPARRARKRHSPHGRRRGRQQPPRAGRSREGRGELAVRGSNCRQRGNEPGGQRASVAARDECAGRLRGAAWRAGATSACAAARAARERGGTPASRSAAESAHAPPSLAAGVVPRDARPRRGAGDATAAWERQVLSIRVLRVILSSVRAGLQNRGVLLYPPPPVQGGGVRAHPPAVSASPPAKGRCAISKIYVTGP
jgi:hypothetical protein